MRASAEQMPFLHGIAPRYLKLVTSSNFWGFVLISALMLCVLLDMVLFISVLTCILCSVYESVDEVLKFTIAAAHKIDVVGKS